MKNLVLVLLTIVFCAISHLAFADGNKVVLLSEKVYCEDNVKSVQVEEDVKSLTFAKCGYDLSIYCIRLIEPETFFQGDVMDEDTIGKIKLRVGREQIFKLGNFVRGTYRVQIFKYSISEFEIKARHSLWFPMRKHSAINLSAEFETPGGAKVKVVYLYYWKPRTKRFEFSGMKCEASNGDCQILE